MIILQIYIKFEVNVQLLKGGFIIMKLDVIQQEDMALYPISNGRGMHASTKILKVNSPSLILPKKPQKVLEVSCRFYGAPYLHKKNEATRITGITSKPPILLTPLFPTYFFPTHSDRKSENAWINIHYVEKIKELKDKRCKIFFVDNQTLTVNVSKHSLDHQYKNSILYNFLMERSVKVFTSDPNNPIDYAKKELNIYEVLIKYAKLFEHKE